MRAMLLLALATVIGCASAGTGTSGPGTQVVRVVGPTSTSSFAVPASDPTNTHELPYALEQVWRALPGAFDALGIPIGVMDPAKRVAGNTALKVRRELKNVPLSRYIDCGGSTQLGPNADSYDVNLSIVAAVRSLTPTTSAVSITFEAVGRPATFAQEYSQCTSKGVLEKRLVDAVSARLKA